MKDESKSTGKSPKKPRRQAKRFGEMSEEDMMKLELPEHLGYRGSLKLQKKKKSGLESFSFSSPR